MEKREPSLVPEWLRSTANGSVVGSKNHFLSSSARLDSSLSHTSKGKNSSRTTTDVDSVRSPSTNARRGFSSNGSTKNAYSSFNVQRTHRDKDRSREKNRLSYMDPWDSDISYTFATFLNGGDQEQLRRSHSRKQGDHLAQGFTMGLRNGRNINTHNRNGILPVPGTSPAKISQKPGLGKDFPLLRTEDRNGSPDGVRISSPGLSPAAKILSVQSIPAGEGWTSALAEVPNVIDKSGSVAHANVGTSITLTEQTCRNMAEALVQAPRTGTSPQGSPKIQRLEDRALKQLRQLIPVVPSTPKGSVLKSFDKSKTKPMVRSGEIGLPSLRNTQQQSSMLLGSQIKPETTKKLVVLKPARENGLSVVKESGGGETVKAASQMTAPPFTKFTGSVGSTDNPRELNGDSVNMLPEKKLSVTQTQSRSAFFSALKKKLSTNISTDLSKASSKELIGSDPSTVQAVEREDIVMERVEKVSERNSGFEWADRPNEKEAEFLKSLGWDESNTEEEALTEEEIRAFVEQHNKVKPSLVKKLPMI